MTDFVLHIVLNPSHDGDYLSLESFGGLILDLFRRSLDDVKGKFLVFNVYNINITEKGNLVCDERMLQISTTFIIYAIL